MHYSGKPLPGTVIEDKQSSQTLPDISTHSPPTVVSIPLDIDKSTPLHLAVRNGDHKATTSLLEKGANPNEQDKIGMTPLHWAALKGQMELAKLLMFFDGDIHIREHFSGGVTPVGLAQLLGYEDVAQMMIDWPG